jgi:hypothetical protein
MSTAVPDFSKNRFRFFCAAPVVNDVAGASFGEREGSGSSDAARCTGNK